MKKYAFNFEIILVTTPLFCTFIKMLEIGSICNSLCYYYRELMKKALPVLVGILEKEARGWFLHFREKVIADLKAQNLSDYEVEKVVTRCLLLHFFSKHLLVF